MTDLPLFAVCASDRKAELERLEQRLCAQIIPFARTAGAHGITASEVIDAAIQHWKIWTGEEWRAHPRAYALVGPLLAKLARKGDLAPLLVQGYHVSRKSTRPKSHSNRNLCYVHPAYAGEQRRTA